MSRPRRQSPGKTRKKAAVVPAPPIDFTVAMANRGAAGSFSKHRSGYWVKMAIAGLFLLPLSYITTLAFLGCLRQVISTGDFRSSMHFWAFFAGALWFAVFWRTRRLMAMYVWGHELTHAFFIKLSGGRLYEMVIGSSGGHVISDRNNLIISLSPYLIPFYTMITILAFTVLGFFTNLNTLHPEALYGFGFRWSWALFYGIGLTWAFHVAFTIRMITRRQPDLWQNGTFFSINLIYLVNLIIILSLLILAIPQFSALHFAASWMEQVGLFAYRIRSIF